MLVIFEVALAAIVVLAFGIPLVIAYDKAKKEMEAEDEKGER